MYRRKVWLAMVSVSLLMPWVSSMPGKAGTLSDCQWGEGKGAVAADTLSPAEARQLALQQARAAAIADATGVEVRADTLTRDFVLAGDFVRTLVRGYIKREHIQQWTQDKYQPSPDQSPIPILRVTVKACVVPATEKRDPGFQLKTTVNKAVFTPGEKARLEVRSTRHAHVTIFNLTSDDMVRVYGGPSMDFPLSVEPHTPVTFPPPGVSLVMELPAGQTRASEAFVVVGTKAEERLELPLSGQAGGMLSLAEFYGSLSAVQGQIIEDIVPYTIMGR